MDFASKIKAIAEQAEQAGNSTRRWRKILTDLADVSQEIRRRLGPSETGTIPEQREEKVAKISTMCNPKLVQLLRAEAAAQNKAPSRLVAEIVHQFIASPPPIDSPDWWDAPIRIVRSLMGRETLTAAVEPKTKRAFEAAVPKVDGVTNKSQLLAWVIWNHLGRPTKRS